MRKRNKTIIKADRIEHVDVAKVHNPRTRRNAAGKADILQQGVKAGLLPAGLVTDLQRLEEGRYSDDPKRRENLMSRAIILRSQLIYRNMIEKDPLNEAAQRALESIIVKEVQWQKQHKQNPRTRRNGKADILQQGVKAGLLPAGLVTDLKRLEEGRFPADPARRANLLQRALKLRNDLVYQNLVEENLLGEAVQRALFDVIARQHRQLRSRRNPRRGSRSWFGSTETQSFFTRNLKSRGKLDLYKDGLEGKEISHDHIPGGSFAFQYAVGRVEPGGEIAVFRRRADERGTYGGWRWETDQNKIIPYVEKSTSGRKVRRVNAEGWRNEYGGAFNSLIFGTRHKKVIDLGRRKRGAERDLVMAYADDLLQLTLKNVAALDDGGLLAELSSKARTSAKRKHKVDPTRAALLLDQAEEIMLGGRRNPAEKDAEHPIEVTRHFRGGPPGYLSPWQKAMAIGQQELFDTGIKLAPRAAELRAARLSNPGATKPVYQSGLKQATAGQLPRLARVGLRVGRTPAEIRSDLATTGRFTAEQIRRAIDQATTAERRSNPPVRQIFETFNGRPATRSTSVQAPRRTPARVAQLGRLRLIRTADGRTWRFPGERAPFLAADSKGKLHVVGGQYRANPAGEECGEIEQIEYQTSKPHLGHDNETIYYHQLGEETGERPILEITPEGELQITGGNYRIEADGIHN